jgi:two-component system, OmpR family, sensor kinase
MRTPSLRRRVIAAGMSVLAVVVLSLEMFLFLSLQVAVERTLQENLEARVVVAREVADTEDPADVAARLASLGIPAVVTSGTGEINETLPVVPRFAPGPPGPVDGVPGTWESQTVDLPDGGHIEVRASRAGVEATMRRVLLLMGFGTLMAGALGWLGLRWATTSAMAPLSEVVAAARRTTSGITGERLQASHPGTELGQLAVAHDAMLDELESALARAIAAETRTRRFVDDAAHQLRTPVAGIRASVETLLSIDDPATRERSMSNLVRETSRANRILHDLLLMARLDTGRTLERTATDVRALIESELERTRSLAPHLTVVCDPVPELSGSMLVDPTALREVVANLLDNARRHADSEVQVHLEITDERLGVRVGDDGPGVAQDCRELVFERFATLDGHGGSGLGLPIARAFAEGHGGSLTCNEAGFQLWLSTAPVIDAPALSSRARSAEQTQPIG